MSLDDPTPTEYFGPHAKRWTNPDTGVTMSLSPREYYRAVAKEQLRREKEVAERIREAESAAWNDEALDEGVVTIDRLGDPRAAPIAGLFKEEGVLIAPLSSWNPPEHQRYDLNAFADEERGDPLQPSEGLPITAPRGGIKWGLVDPDLAKACEAVAEVRAAADTAAAAARSAEESRDEALADAGLSIAPGGGLIPQPSTVRFLSLSEDDRFGLIRPVEQSAPGKPAARHFRRRKMVRIAAALGLVYIIAVIGVLAVAGVIS